MPSFSFSQALTANQAGFNPITGWQFEYVPSQWRGAAVRLLTRATTTGVRVTVFTGSSTVQQRAPVQGGGTAGVTPSDLNTPPIAWIASPGDRLIPTFDEVSGGTPTIDGQLIIEPI